MSEFDSRGDPRERNDGRDDHVRYPQFDLSVPREIERERVVSLAVRAASPELVVNLFSSISPEITHIVEQHLLPSLESGQLFDPVAMVRDYDALSPYWLRQERTLFLGKGRLRELGHKVSLYDWDKTELKPAWDVARSRRRLNALDITISFPDGGRESSWILADRIGDVLGLGSVRARVRRSHVEGQSQADGSFSAQLAPGIAVSTRRQETPEERAAIDRDLSDRFRSNLSWLPKTIEVSEPLYGEMRSALSALDSDHAAALVGSGMLRYADRLVLSGESVREERLGQIIRKMEKGFSVVFGRSIALGRFEGTHPLEEGLVNRAVEPNEELASEFEQEESPSQEVDSLTSVEINGVPSRLGECTVSFHSASQEVFASELRDVPSFDKDKPVLEVKFPDLVKRPNEVERNQRTGLARQICADIDSQLNLDTVAAELDRMGFEKGPEHGFVREAQYSRGKIKLTFEGA